jgi:hypothetical protein
MLINKHDKIQYVRDAQGDKTGVMIALVSSENPNKVNIGYSFCAPQDTFDKEWGIIVAANRSGKITERMMDKRNLERRIHPKNIEHLRTFVSRCKTYYKDKELPKWIDLV